MTTQITTLGTKELWERFVAEPLDIYAGVAQRMKDAGVDEPPTMTRVLEEVSPTDPTDKSGLDAYERMLLEAGIRTQSDPFAGYWASNAGQFCANRGTRALLTEFFARNWRKVSFGHRATLLSDDGIVGSWERPYADALTVRQDTQVAPAIPLSELVAMTTGIDSDAYRSFYLTYDAEQLRQYRVGESTDIPLATLTGSTHTIRLKKYGRGVRASYEDLRRMRVDRLAWYIRWMAVQSEIDKVAAALAVLVAGDGNANTAATSYDLTDLDTGATAGTLSLEGWLALKMEFENPYFCTTALMQKDMARQVALLNTGSANVVLATISGGQGGLGTDLTLINQFSDGVRYGYTSEAPANKIVCFDRRLALERVTEIGSEISEMERFVLNQTQVVVMSEVEGYSVMDGNATKILVVNA